MRRARQHPVASVRERSQLRAAAENSETISAFATPAFRMRFTQRKVVVRMPASYYAKSREVLEIQHSAPAKFHAFAEAIKRLLAKWNKISLLGTRSMRRQPVKPKSAKRTYERERAIRSYERRRAEAAKSVTHSNGQPVEAAQD
jgi:hypothetical protein